MLRLNANGCVFLSLGWHNFQLCLSNWMLHVALAKLEATLNKTNANLMLINPPAGSFATAVDWKTHTHTHARTDALPVLQKKGEKKKIESCNLSFWRIWIACVSSRSSVSPSLGLIIALCVYASVCTCVCSSAIPCRCVCAHLCAYVNA